jgi:cytosine/adenosine deaminase-related metal-dependent hydrolase
MAATFQRRDILAGGALLPILSMLPSTTGALASDRSPNNRLRIAIENVAIVPMTEGSMTVRNATVVIENGRITALQGPAPRGSLRINGRGKFLIPGLMDMHVHLPSDQFLPDNEPPRNEPPRIAFDTQDIMTPYIANGVTQIMNMDADAIAIGRRNQVAAGQVIGPNMALAALIDGRRPDGRVALTPADGRQAVRDAKAEGYGFIKLYWRLDVETFLAINDEARIQQMKVLGHIPDSFEGQVERAFVPNFMIAHAEELAKQSATFADADATRFAELARANGTALTGSLTTMRWIASQTRSLDELRALPTLRYLHPVVRRQWVDRNSYNQESSPRRIAYFERMVDFNRRLVSAFKAAGALVVAGTDALNPGCVPGFSMHDELAMLVDAGLTNSEALAAATRLPAQWMGMSDSRGTIEIGKRADLVLLDADPLESIGNTRRIAGVIVNGQWLPRAQLDRMLASVAAHNAAFDEANPPST